MNHPMGDTMTEASSDHNERRSEALKHHLAQVGATAGSLHHVHHLKTHLVLEAAVGLPSGLLPTIQKIIIGKGLAGLAWAEERIVSSCDLKHDPNVGQKAKPLSFASTHAIPIFANGGVRSVLGVAFQERVQLTPGMLKSLRKLPRELSN